MADDSADTRTWFLRISTGTVFGPVSTQGLQTWAEQGRVQAGNAVSPDRKNWQAAETLAELNISWFIEDDSGQLVGPFHKRAAQKIIDERRAPDGARLVAAEDADLSRLRRSPAAGGTGSTGDLQPELDLATNGDDGAEQASAAWTEERESLRLRIAELEEQTRNLLKAAEKDSRSLARQLDQARRQIAAMERELEELRPQAAAAAGPAGGPPANQALAEQVEAARRELEELRQDGARQVDALKAGLDEAHAARQMAVDEAAALKTELDAARAAHQTAVDEAAALKTALEEARSARQSELDDALLAARQDVDTLKKRIAELVGQLAEQATENESAERLRVERDALASSLREARGSYAELLEYSNARDEAHARELAEAAEQCAALQEQVDAAAAVARAAADEAQQEPAQLRELHARLHEQETLLAGILGEDLQTVEKMLALEREAFTTLRDGSLQRQALLQARLTAVQKLQGGETTDVFEREAKVRSDKAQSARMQDALTALQAEHARFVRQAEARERELVSRVRMLELEEERLKERAAEAEPLYQRNQHLTELLNDREQKLAQERQQRSIEQAQLEQAHQTLLNQIETHRQTEPVLPLAAAEAADVAEPSPSRATFRVTPWMRLKK